MINQTPLLTTIRNCHHNQIDIAPSEKRELLAVMGSLKQGYGNHRLLGGSEYLWDGYTLPKYSMLNFGSFPGLIDGKKSCRVEVYEVSPEILKRIDGLEGYIVVESNGALLICKKDNEQKIRDFVADVKLRNDGNKYI